jgi:hypothetical protein
MAAGGPARADGLRTEHAAFFYAPRLGPAFGSRTFTRKELN